jgi:hypothetical protein
MNEEEELELAEALKLQLLLKEQGDVNIAPPVPTDEVMARVEDTSTIRSDMASEGMELVGTKVDIPDEVPLYSKDGVQVPIPKPVQFVLEGLANLGISAVGLGEAGLGYVVGLIADGFVKSGIQNKTEAERLARDVMAAPDAFAGNLGTIARGSIPKIPKVKTDKKPVEATVKPVETLEMPEAEIGKLIRTASSKGMGSDKALEKLIAQAKINPEIKDMAERLGFNLPFDIFAEGEIVKRAAGLTRDVKTSVAEVTFRAEVQDAINRADAIMKELGATDLSTISGKIGDTLRTTQETLKTKESDLYDRVDGNVEKKIPALIQKTEKIDIVNTLNQINKFIEEEGLESLSPKIKAILKRENLTYGALLRLKEDVGDAAFKGKGPYAEGTSTGQLKLIYKTLRDDQFTNAIRIGGNEVEDLLKTANQLTVKRKELEDSIVRILGKDLQGSVAPKLKGAITSGAKGDISNTNRIISVIPKELRKEAILTALQDATRGKDISGNVNFGLAEFNTMYQKLKDQKVVFKELSKELGPETTKVLDELSEISKRITVARANVDVTGKANQAVLLKTMQAEGILEKFLGGSVLARVTRGGLGGAAGLVSGVPYIAPATAAIFQAIKISPKERLKMAGDLFNDTRFRTLIDNISETGTASVKTINDLANSPVYKRWAKTIGIEDPRNWLNITIERLALTADTDAIPVEQEGIPTEPEELTQSSALQSIIEQADPETRDRILQQV